MRCSLNLLVPLMILAAPTLGLAQSQQPQQQPRLNVGKPLSQDEIKSFDFMIGPEGQKLFSEKYGYGSPRKDLGFKRWYPEQGLSSYDYANTIERWNKILLQISKK